LTFFINYKFQVNFKNSSYRTEILLSGFPKFRQFDELSKTLTPAPLTYLAPNV